MADGPQGLLGVGVGGEHPPARDLERITPERIRVAVSELAGLVDERLPERFYPGEGTTRLVLTALIARMASILESIGLLAEPERRSDALVLLRTLYEHAVTFLWLAIDPRPRVYEWYGHTLRHRRTLHREALDYGARHVLSEDQLAQADEAALLAPLEQRAKQIDDHWGPRIIGFHVDAPDAPRNILTWRGLYTAIYRLGSRNVHGTIESVDPWVHPERSGRTVVRREPRPTDLPWPALALPVFSMVLVVSHERLGWPDEQRVREINDALLREDPETNARS